MIEVNPDLLSFLMNEEEQSYDGTLFQKVEEAIKAYNGDPYGDEEDGRSQVVARDVSESVNYMLTSMLDVFVSSGRLVEFEPTGDEEEDAADDATEAMHYIYRRKSGYRLIHDWAKSGLMEKIGIVKSCVERKRRRQEQIIPAELLPGESEEELRAAGVIEAEEVEPGMFRVVVLAEEQVSFPDYHIPLEEFRFSSDARDFDNAVYLAHVSEKTLSQLAEMGFDTEDIGPLEYDNIVGSELSYARDSGRDSGREYMRDSRGGALRKATLREEYPLFDLNGDGIAERLCVHRVGSTILNIEELDYQPFEYWCPYPMQGRLVGQSLADQVVDIQRVNTALERNAYDSLYMSVAPGSLVNVESATSDTYSDLLVVRPRRIVRYKGPIAPTNETVADVSGIAFNAIEFKTRQRESRTGITRLNKGIDEDTLNDTAKGQAMLMARGQQMERYIVRNFAEGVARLFMKKISMMRQYGQPFRIKVDGVFRMVDPTQWPEGLEVDIKVGLGSGSKEERINYRNLVAQAHTALMQAGSPIANWENVYNNLAGLAKDMGLQPNDLFINPENAPPEQEQPDPAMLKLQADTQLKTAELQMKHAHNQAQLQLKLMEIQGKMQLAREDAETQLMLAQQKAFIETQLATQEQEFEAMLAALKIKASEAGRESHVAGMRPGGRLDR